MSYCQACQMFCPQSERHKAELKIVETFDEFPYRIELPVCLCCWYAIAFRGASDRRRLACPGSTETVYVYRIRNLNIGQEYKAALDRSYKESLFYRLYGGK